MFKGRTAHCSRLAVRKVFASLEHSKKLRDVRKIEMGKIWKDRVDISSGHCGLPDGYAFREGLARTNIALNNNMLQILAIYEPRTFSVSFILILIFQSLVDVVKQYYVETGVNVDGMNNSQNVISGGMLTSPIVPGNKTLYE